MPDPGCPACLAVDPGQPGTLGLRALPAFPEALQPHIGAGGPAQCRTNCREPGSPRHGLAGTARVASPKQRAVLAGLDHAEALGRPVGQAPESPEGLRVLAAALRSHRRA